MIQESIYFPGNLPVSVAQAICTKWPAVSVETRVRMMQTNAGTLELPVLKPTSGWPTFGNMACNLLCEPRIPMPAFRAALWRFLGWLFDCDDLYMRGTDIDIDAKLALAQAASPFAVERIVLSKMELEDGTVMWLGYGPRSDLLAVRMECVYDIDRFTFDNTGYAFCTLKVTSGVTT